MNDYEYRLPPFNGRYAETIKMSLDELADSCYPLFYNKTRFIMGVLANALSVCLEDILAESANIPSEDKDYLHNLIKRLLEIEQECFAGKSSITISNCPKGGKE